MTQEQRHTGLPWSINSTGEISAEFTHKTRGHKFKAAIAWIKHATTHNAAESEANAEFIVRACNVFYEREAELERLRISKDELLAIAKYMEENWEYDINHPHFLKCRQAIAKAEGK